MGGSAARRRQRDRGRGVQRVGRPRGGAGGPRLHAARPCSSVWTSRCPRCSTRRTSPASPPPVRSAPQAAAILQQYLDHARTAYGTTGVVVHDALALTEAIRPGFLGTVRRDVVVDTGLGAGRGQTLVDRRTVSSAPTAVDVAEQVDSAAAVEFLASRLAGLDALTGRSQSGSAGPGRSLGQVRRALRGWTPRCRARCRGACGCSAGRPRAGSRRPARRRRAAAPSARPSPARSPPATPSPPACSGPARRAGGARRHWRRRPRRPPRPPGPPAATRGRRTRRAGSSSC